ncbi:MAG: fused DSP-PTPase phosphatase/NAD kinase-like protein, partial [Candidatus Poseidoniaceae archaeon]
MRKWKTSESDPLRIDEIHLEGCKIGISFCPGKVQEFAMSGSWDRDLDADLDVIASSGYNVVLSLIEYREFEELQVEGFLESAVQNNDMEWIWAPIRDGETPTPSNHSALARTLDAVKQKKSVFIHCKGGLGRAGSVAAWLLSHFGRTGLESIK